MSFTLLASSIQIGSLKLKHRVIMGPMWSRLCTVGGEVTQQMIDYYSARARGGPAMIIIESTVVDSRYRWHEPTLLLDDPIFQPGLARVVDVIHLNNIPALFQLVNVGTFSANPISPSGIPSVMIGGTGVIQPRALSLAEIEEQRDKFINSAVLAKELGADGVLVHGATAYLLHQFVSPYTNKRDDKYGGSLENRNRLPLEIVKGIREKCGSDFVVGYELVADELLPNGLTLEHTVPLAKALEREGIDFLDSCVGTYETFATNEKSPGQSKYTRFGAWSYTEAFKKEIDVPVTHRTQGDYDPTSWEKHLTDGDADIIQVAKPSLCDPEIFRKAVEGRLEDIRQCTDCCHCLDEGIIGHHQVECALNPETGRERSYTINKTSKTKKVLVVGAGPGGLEAARIAALRGHEVILMDKETEPGGNLRYIALCSENEPFRAFRDWEVRKCKEAGVVIELGKEVTPKVVGEINPEVVIIATGAAEHIIPDIPGISQPHVVIPEEVLTGKVRVGDKVVIIGGNRIGVDVAYTIAKKGLAKKVTIVEPKIVPVIGYDMEVMNMMMQITVMLPKYGVQALTGTQIKEITDSSVIVINPEGKTNKIEADTVVLSMGYKTSSDTLDKELTGKVKQVYVIGDRVKPRKIRDAVHEAAYIARQI